MDITLGVPQYWNLVVVGGIPYTAILGPNSQFSWVSIFPLLPRQDMNSLASELGEQQQQLHLNNVFTAWQNDPALRRDIDPFNTMEDPANGGCLSLFATNADKKLRGFKKSEKNTDQRVWEVGFDSRIFARSGRLSPKRAPIICPFTLRGTNSEWDLYNADHNVWYRRSAACLDLEELGGSDNPMPVSPELDRLATAFFNGDAIPEDLDDLQSPLNNNGPNYKVAYNTSGWTEVLNVSILTDKAMVTFLQDVIMANELEKACLAKISYDGLIVYRHKYYARVVNLNNAKKSGSTLTDTVETEKLSSKDSHPNNNINPLQIASELLESTKPENLPPGGEPSKGKKGRNKKKRAFDNKKTALDNTISDNYSNIEDEAVPSLRRRRLNDSLPFNEIVKKSSSKAPITTPSANLGLSITPALCDFQGEPTEDPQSGVDDMGWVTVGAKSYQRSRSFSQQVSQSSVSKPSLRSSRGIKQHTSTAINQYPSSQRAESVYQHPRNQSSSKASVTMPAKSADVSTLPGVHELTNSVENIANKEGMSKFDSDNYPPLPSSHATPAAHPKDHKPNGPVTAEATLKKVVQSEELSNHPLDHVEDRQIPDRSATAPVPPLNTASSTPKSSPPDSKAASPVSTVSSGLALPNSTAKPSLTIEPDSPSSVELEDLELGNNGPTSDAADYQQELFASSEQPSTRNTEVASSHYSTQGIITGAEEDYLADHQNHPRQGNNEEGGDTSHPHSNISCVSATTGSAERTPGQFHCSFCKKLSAPSIEAPGVLCPGCGVDFDIIYCSIACMLVDSYAHSTKCMAFPASQRSRTPDVLFECVYQKNPIFQVDRFPVVSPEKFRQKAFSMFCHSGPFPQLLRSWASCNSTVDLQGVKIAEAQKRSGDYHVFRSEITANSPRYNPTADVIFTVKLRVGDHLKAIFSRVLNACFLTHHPHIIEFLFRMIRSFILDPEMFEMLPHEENCSIVLKEFKHQFSKEFACNTEHYNESWVFDFDQEWPQVAPFLMDLEYKHPILFTWMRYRTRQMHCQYAQ